MKYRSYISLRERSILYGSKKSAWCKSMYAINRKGSVLHNWKSFQIYQGHSQGHYFVVRTAWTHAHSSEGCASSCVVPLPLSQRRGRGSWGQLLLLPREALLHHASCTVPYKRTAWAHKQPHKHSSVTKLAAAGQQHSNLCFWLLP